MFFSLQWVKQRTARSRSGSMGACLRFIKIYTNTTILDLKHVSYDARHIYQLTCLLLDIFALKLDGNLKNFSELQFLSRLPASRAFFTSLPFTWPPAKKCRQLRENWYKNHFVYNLETMSPIKKFSRMLLTRKFNIYEYFHECILRVFCDVDEILIFAHTKCVCES